MHGTFLDYEEDATFAPDADTGLLVRTIDLRGTNNDLFSAYVLRSRPGARPSGEWEGADQTFFLTFIEEGWVDIEIESLGHHRLIKGHLVHTQNGERHRMIACSEDMQSLNIVSTSIVIDQPKCATVQSYADADWGDGLRTHVLYRDFAHIEKATGGVIGGHHGKIIKEAPKDNSKEPVQRWHQHDWTAQLFYIFGGWAEFDFGDVGVNPFKKGVFMVLPNGMPHAEVQRQVGLETFEIVHPAQFGTAYVDEADLRERFNREA